MYVSPMQGCKVRCNCQFPQVHTFPHLASYGWREFLITGCGVIPEQFTAIGPPSFIWRGGGRGEGQKKLWWHTFQRLRPEEFSSGDYAGDFGLRSFFLARRFTVKAHSTNTNTNTDTNTDLPILKILRFVNFGRKLLRPKPLESVPMKVKVKVFLRIIFARKLASYSSPTAGVPD